MMDTVRLLREGWYGTYDLYPKGHPSFKQEVSCSALVASSMKEANQKFVPLCKGLQGTIGSLLLDPTYKKNQGMLPIDTLVATMAKEEEVFVTESDDETVIDDVGSVN